MSKKKKSSGYKHREVAENPKVFMGLTMNQLLLIGGAALAAFLIWQKIRSNKAAASPSALPRPTQANGGVVPAATRQVTGPPETRQAAVRGSSAPDDMGGNVPGDVQVDAWSGL